MGYQRAEGKHASRWARVIDGNIGGQMLCQWLPEIIVHSSVIDDRDGDKSKGGKLIGSLLNSEAAAAATKRSIRAKGK